MAARQEAAAASWPEHSTSSSTSEEDSDAIWNVFLRDSVMALTGLEDGEDEVSKRKTSMATNNIICRSSEKREAAVNHLPSSWLFSNGRQDSTVVDDPLKSTAVVFLPSPPSKKHVLHPSSLSKEETLSPNNENGGGKGKCMIPNWTQRSDFRRRHSLASMYPESSSSDGSLSFFTASSPCCLYTVRFKRHRQGFYLGKRGLRVGVVVLVEADRGQDLGTIVAQPPDELHGSSAGLNYKRILQVASDADIKQMEGKRLEEEHALNVCRLKVYERMLPMNILEAEYQYDGNKLTFYFSATGRIDFRDLVKELFSMFKTRIWMQQLNEERPSLFAPVRQQPPPPGFKNATPRAAPAS